MLLVVFPGVINDVRNDGGNIIVIGDRGGIICGNADVMITLINLVQQSRGEDRTHTRQRFLWG